MTIGERLKKLRKALNLTQQEFSDKLKISRSNIATYEVGKSDPAEAVINLICREFNVSETWLRTGEGEMFVPKKEDALDELAKQRGLTRGDRILVEKFLDLKPTSRQAVMEYMKKVVAALSADSPAVQGLSSAPVDTRTRSEKPVSEWTQAEIDAEAEEYRRELFEEKRQAESGSASSGSGGTRLA